MKKLEELINEKESGWELVKEWLNNSTNHYEVLPRDKTSAEKELIYAQVSTRSPMGAIIYETGGVLIDNGWIRILGSGSNPKLNRGLMEWNKGKSIENYGDQQTFLLVADDVIGGYFALNAGGVGDEIGNIYYLPQDTLIWESLGCGYSDFLNWTFSGNIQKFYELFKWKNWRADLETINGNQTFSFFPFLWTKYDDFEQVTRKVVPTEENYKLTLEMQKVIVGK
jgi:hypothetical protein